MRPAKDWILYGKRHSIVLSYKENLLIFPMIWKKNSSEKFLFFFLKLPISKILIGNSGINDHCKEIDNEWKINRSWLDLILKIAIDWLERIIPNEEDHSNEKIKLTRNDRFYARGKFLGDILQLKKLRFIRDENDTPLNRSPSIEYTIKKIPERISVWMYW